MHSSNRKFNIPPSLTGKWGIWFAKPSRGWGFDLCLGAVGKIELEVSRLQFFFPDAWKGWNAYNLHIWHCQSKLWTYIIRQSTDRPPTVDRYSADKQRSTYRPSVGRYIDRDICRESVDMSTIYRPSNGRYVDRYTGRGVHKIHL